MSIKDSHFVFIDKLPEDVIKVSSYREHTFESLYYSPSKNEFYQAPKTKYRKIEPDKSSIRVRSDAGRTVRLSLRFLNLGVDESSFPSFARSENRELAQANIIDDTSQAEISLSG